MPPELGNWNSVHRQYRRWTTPGLWEVLPQALADGGGGADALQMIDSTVVRAQVPPAVVETPEWSLCGESRG